MDIAETISDQLRTEKIFEVYDDDSIVSFGDHVIAETVRDHGNRIDALECAHAEEKRRSALRMQLVLRVREEAAKLSGVSAAYVRCHGELCFTVTGPTWTSELSEAVAEMAARLQDELSPNCDEYVDGGYEMASEPLGESWLRVFSL